MKHLKQGEQAPAWKGIDENGQEIGSADFVGQKWVLYFYPKDNTPGCINQACNLRDNMSELKARGIAVVGVSADNEKSHKKFIAGKKLNFPLVADVDKELLNLFGVWGTKKFMGRTYDGIHRTSFLMNEAGTIVDIIEKPKTKQHAEEIIEKFEENSRT